MTDRDELARLAEAAAHDLEEAYQHVPPSQRGWRAAETAWSARDVLAHTLYWTAFFTAQLRGEAWDWASEADWAAAQRDRLEEGAQALDLAAELHRDHADAIRGLTAEDLAQPTALPWGTMPTERVIHFNNAHIAYHVGQLNYIQTLLGDREDQFFPGEHLFDERDGTPS